MGQKGMYLAGNIPGFGGNRYISPPVARDRVSGTTGVDLSWSLCTQPVTADRTRMWQLPSIR